MKYWIFVLLFLIPYSSTTRQVPQAENEPHFVAASDFLDAAINSMNAFNSLVTKENYRIKITSFNNPTSTEMGFSLEAEIQNALKPLLAKAKNVNSDRFNEVISSIIGTQGKLPATKPMILSWNPVFTTIVSVVSNMVVQEKRISRADLDSFILTTSRYFIQYQKLLAANVQFDQNLDKINYKLKEIQFHIREYMLDLITILYRNSKRSEIKLAHAEELYLKYLDKLKLQVLMADSGSANFHFPSDGIKNAKDIAYSLQKLFNEYQKLYEENFVQIRTILVESKALGRHVNTRQVDASLKELEELYTESRNSDVLGLRLTTLMERLRFLVETEQKGRGK